MISTMLTSHIIIVTAFLLFMLVKVILLFAAKAETVANFRSKTKVVDMVLGSLILVTGFYLMFSAGGHPPTYLMVKIVLVFLAIPLGIIGFKRSNKVLATLSLLLILYTYGIAETKSLTFQKAKVVEVVQTEGMTEMEVILANGKNIYAVHCVQCHGEDGKLGLFNSGDLTESVLPQEEAINQITNGKGAMRAFNNELTAEQIEQVAVYIQTLKNN
jgi:cytochrome c553